MYLVMNLFEKTGKMALGSRLRMLTAKITDDAANIYALYGMEFSPKWFPVFYVLANEGQRTITEIAEDIGHSQPSVTNIVKEMMSAGIITKLKSTDKRTTLVALNEKGEELAIKSKVQLLDVEAAIDTLIAEARYNLWEAIAEWEFLLKEKPLLRRVIDERKRRESNEIRIVAYEPKYQSAFKSLNEEWISSFFEMEAADYKALDNPKEYILDNGGKIFVALYKDEPLGVCALIKMNDEEYDYELAKMAVSPKAQGKNMGFLLGSAVVKAAKEMGARKLYLESNTLLKPAINLYQKLGFKKIIGRHTPYTRCNIQMELLLNK